MRPWTVEDKAQIALELREQVWPLLESRAVKVVLDRVFPLEQAAEAHRYLEAGGLRLAERLRGTGRPPIQEVFRFG